MAFSKLSYQSKDSHRKWYLFDDVSVFFIVIALVLSTFLRISLVFIYPLFVAFICVGLRLRFSTQALWLILFMSIIWVVSLWNGIYLRYNFWSFFHIVPFVIMLFGKPDKRRLSKLDLVKVFFTIITVVVAVDDVLGVYQIVQKTATDDSFLGFYTAFASANNGLAVLNSVIFVYYFYTFWQTKEKAALFWCGFFLVASMLGFYGGGVIVLIGAFVCTYLKPKLSSLFTTILVSVVSLVLAYYLLLYLKPQTLEYDMQNIKKFLSFDVKKGPRKLAVFYYYATEYPKNTKDFLLGSGPGTFNSRSAFIVGSPYYFTALPFIKSSKQPYYFEHFAYTLWNNTNTSMALYQDGFRNQPFSSLLSLLGEFGLLFTFLFSVYLLNYYNKVMNINPVRNDEKFKTYSTLFKFFMLMMIFLLVIDNYLEYPEIILPILVVIKLLEKEMVNYSIELSKSS